MSIVLTFICISTLIVWVVCAVIGWTGITKIQKLSAVKPDLETWPKLSVIIAARNEEDKIKDVALSLLHQNYPALEVIVVNDDSSDSTGELLDSIDDPALQVLHHKGQPPVNWLGKNYAMQLGAQHATGKILLFTDGDVIFAKNSLKKSIAALKNSETDHLVVFPDMIVHSIWEQLFTLQFSTIFFMVFPVWKLSQPNSDVGMGIGAFNMLTQNCYQAIGGHKTIRMNIDDDVALGQLIASNRYKTYVLHSDGEVAVRWQNGLIEYIKGLEKNAYPAANMSLFAIFAGLVGMVGMSFIPWVALISGILTLKPMIFWCGAFSLTAMLYYSAALGRMTHNSFWIILLLPAGALLVSAAFLNSAYATIKNGGVRWRDRFYSTEQIKKYRWYYK